MNQLLFLKPILTFFLLALSVQVFSQNIAFKSQGDAIQADILGMDTFLVPFKGHDVPEPRYDYLWITNDGQYYFTGDGSTVTHRFDLDKIGGPGGTGVFRTYATAIYSDHEDDEPPKIIIGDTPIGVTPGEPASTESLQDSGLVRLQKNHLNIVPDDTTVFILSAKNNLEDSSFINAYLLLLYDAPLSIVSKDLSSSSISTSPVREASSPPLYTSFDVEQAFIHFDNTAPASYSAIDASGTSLGESFKKAQLFQLQEMAPGEERHIYVQLKNSEVHIDAIPSGGIGGTRFMAIMLVDDFQGEIILPELSQQEQRLLNDVKLNSFTDQGVVVTNAAGGADTIFVSNYQPVGVSEVYSTVARSHDPNQISLQACECPANSAVAQKVICRVDFENTGAGATGDVSVRIPFPEALNISTFNGQLISLFPNSDALMQDMEVKKDTVNNELTFLFPGLRLEGKQVGEDNYLSRTGHLTFTIFTEPGTDITAVEPIQACITFDDNVPFCTPESGIELMDNQSVHESLAEFALNCEKCEVPEGGSDGFIVLGMPLWLLILILLVITVGLYFAFFDN